MPGVHTAIWAGEPRDFHVAMKKVEDLLQDAGATDRSARFVSCLAVVWPDGHEEVFEGYVEGDLVWPPRGEKGFGYDPVFIAKGETETFGEMDQTHKHAISHRAAAFRQLVVACFESI